MSKMSPDDLNEKIELLINDENRIITYKILSQELKIHVNRAKQYMMEFYNTQKSKGVKLEVNYFLAGFVEMNGLRSVRVIVVSGDNVEKAKECFAELTSCHMFSICKGVPKEECTLYAADFAYTSDIEELKKYSAIKHPDIEMKPPILTKMPPIQDLKTNFSKKVESKAASNGKSSVDSKKSSPEKNVSPKDNEKKDTKINKSSPDSKKQKSGTLESMWQKKDKSNGVKNVSAKPEAKGKPAAKSVPKNNIMSMFSKQSVKNAEKPPTLKPVPKEIPETHTPDVVREPSPKKVKPSEGKKSSQKRKVANKNSKSSKSKHESDSESEFRSKPKKHRRICTFDDSDSESEPEEEKEKAQRSFFLPEEPIETAVATPLSDDSEEPIPPTPPVVHVRGKAKVWKTVQKTYEDDDGFFVTKKEKELVSEDEEDPLKDTTDKKNEVVGKKSPAKQNKKQASLMSFFKQK